VKKVAEYAIVVLNASSNKLLSSMSKETYYKGKRELVEVKETYHTVLFNVKRDLLQR
jgi:hypothetical protein